MFSFNFAGTDIITAAELQLECAGGIEDTPFVTIKVTMNEKSEMISEAYQISKQGMTMVAEGVLLPSIHLGMCQVNPTFTALVEGKQATEIDTDFFLTLVPITGFESETFVSFFPKSNRDGFIPTPSDLKNQLTKVGKQGWNLQSLLSDFHLLLYISTFFNIHEDMPIICQSILNKEIPLNEGYVLILNSLAGLG